MSWRLISSALLAVALVACADKPRSGASFISARLKSVDAVEAASGDVVSVDGTYRLVFTPQARLSGAEIHHDVTYVRTGARPVPGLDYYLLIDGTGDQARVIWSGLKENGICLDAATAERYGVSASLQSLQREHPCRN